MLAVGAHFAFSSPLMPLARHTPTAYDRRTSAITAIIEPGLAWEEWSLSDVGIFDGAFLAAGAAAVFLVANRDDELEEFDADDAVSIAEENLRRSVENSPCNGPSIEALEALESADAAAAARRPAADPNELRPFEALRRRSNK